MTPAKLLLSMKRGCRRAASGGRLLPSKDSLGYGWRLWARSDSGAIFMKEEWDFDLRGAISERRLRNEYGRSYEADDKRKTHEKILLLRADGSAADAKGSIGSSWTGVSQTKIPQSRA